MKNNLFIVNPLGIIALGVLLFLGSSGFSQSINVVGSTWTPKINSVTQAGMDYVGPYESATNLLTLSGNLSGSLLNLLGGKGARVNVSYIPNVWNNDLKLFAKRSNGKATVEGVICLLCTASIGGELDFIEIQQGIETSLFTLSFTGLLGLGNSVSFSGVNVQYKLTGVSVVLPVDNYSSTVVYTIGAL